MPTFKSIADKWKAATALLGLVVSTSENESSEVDAEGTERHWSRHTAFIYGNEDPLTAELKSVNLRKETKIKTIKSPAQSSTRASTRASSSKASSSSSTQSSKKVAYCLFERMCFISR